MQKVIGSSVAASANNGSSTNGPKSSSASKIKLVNGKSSETGLYSAVNASQFDINSLMMAASSLTAHPRHSLKHSDKENGEEALSEDIIPTEAPSSNTADILPVSIDEDESDSNYLNKLRRHTRPLTNLNSSATSSTHDVDDENAEVTHANTNMSGNVALSNKAALYASLQQSGAKKRKRIFTTMVATPNQTAQSEANMQRVATSLSSNNHTGKYVNDEADGEDLINDENTYVVNAGANKNGAKHMKLTENIDSLKVDLSSSSFSF